MSEFNEELKRELREFLSTLKDHKFAREEVIERVKEEARAILRRVALRRVDITPVDVAVTDGIIEVNIGDFISN